MVRSAGDLLSSRPPLVFLLISYASPSQPGGETHSPEERLEVDGHVHCDQSPLH